MPVEVSEKDYLKLCDLYPIFKQIKFDYFGPKIWLVFVALKSGGVSQETVATRPCQSLMEHNVTFDQIGYFLEELKENKILRNGGTGTYHIIPEIAYELHRVCYKMSKNIEKHLSELKQIVVECGYPNNQKTKSHLNDFTSGDDNAKSEALKDLLAELAYAGARLLIKCIVKLEEKME